MKRRPGNPNWVKGADAPRIDGSKPKKRTPAVLKMYREFLARGRRVHAGNVAARKAAAGEALKLWLSSGPVVPAGDLRDIVEMVVSPGWLGDTNISPAQLSILKAIYGLEMTVEEREVFLQMTEGRPPKAGGYAESSIIAGVGGGKTDKILANIMVYEAITFDTTVLAPGETAAAILTAQDEKAARIALDYIGGKLRLIEERGHPIFMPHDLKEQKAPGPRRGDVVASEIRLRPNLVIKAFPCKKVSTRGVSGIAGGMDELAWWRTEPNAYNSDREVERAIRGRRRAHTRLLRLVKISSPYGEEGVLYEDWQGRASGRKLIVHAPTWVLNPAITRESLLDEELDDPEAFARDRGAQFGKVGGNYISGTLVDLCTDRDRREANPPDRRNHYVGALDVAFKGDQYAAGVGHLEDEKVVVDDIFVRQGSKRVPLDDKEVNREASEFFRAYWIDKIFGDQFADVPTKTEFRTHDIGFVAEAQTAATNWMMWKNLKAVMKRGLLRLPDTPDVRRSLMCLVATPMQGGLTRVAAPDRMGSHDDIAKVLSILVYKIMPLEGVYQLRSMNRGAMPEKKSENWENDIMGAIL